jgi:hypothetical protein
MIQQNDADFLPCCRAGRSQEICFSLAGRIGFTPAPADLKAPALGQGYHRMVIAAVPQGLA